MTETTIKTLDGASFEAMAALPKGEHGPGLIVIHELFSSPDTMNVVNQYYAALGYVVVSPNLFHRQSLSTNLPQTGEPDWEQATKLYKNFDVEAGVRDLLATLGHVRSMPECSGKVGAVGYCLGSRMAFLMATRSDVDCAVGYYGVGIESFLDEVYDIRMPLLLHFGENDKLIPPTTQQRVLKALSKNTVIQTQTYPGAEHGFAREEGPTFHPVHAAAARQKTEDFLKDCLLT